MDEKRRQAIYKAYALEKPSPGYEACSAFVEQADMTPLPEKVPDPDEVRKEGQILHARYALRQVLAVRGLSLSPNQEERIERCEELDVLDEWLDNAVTATTLENVFS